jgi:acetyl-CoA acetyltransferase
VVLAGMDHLPGVTTLINSSQYYDKQLRLETMWVGGGQGMALILKRLS